MGIVDFIQWTEIYIILCIHIIYSLFVIKYITALAQFYNRSVPIRCMSLGTADGSLYPMFTVLYSNNLLVEPHSIIDNNILHLGIKCILFSLFFHGILSIYLRMGKFNAKSWALPALWEIDVMAAIRVGKRNYAKPRGRCYDLHR